MLTSLRYWFGEPDSEYKNLATCVWRSRADAVKGGQGSAHKKASRATHSLYTWWKIDKHRLSIGEGAKTWSIGEWTE